MKGNKYRVTSFRDEIFIDETNIEEVIYRLNTSYEMMKELYEDSEEEIERLKQGYCELKEKCNKGECDCTHEEYNSMCEQNIKMDLEIERLNSIIKEVREYIISELITEWDIKNGGHVSGSDLPVEAITPILEILDKENSKTKEVMPVEELEEYEPKNMAELEYQDWFWD